MAAAPLRALRRTLPVIAPLGVLFTFGYTITIVHGHSMQPHFNPNTSPSNDTVLLDRVSVLAGRFSQGDVVILTAPHDPDMKLIKRIIGLPGDAVRPRQGAAEGMGSWSSTSPTSHSSSELSSGAGYIRIPRGHCWVESDEPFRGVDSNVFGPVPLGLIDARVEMILWPFERLGRVKRTVPKQGRVVPAGRVVIDVEGHHLI
ncbi:hypothetical protein HKX48_008654 [Thoreauomyces humboldtii]|nr:hypothetical protein HKX48_008654 [Thoreauomyces humboldtii]